MQPDPYAEFAEAALKKLHEPKPRKPRVSVASVEQLLLSAGRVGALSAMPSYNALHGLIFLPLLRAALSALEVFP
jgi:hypothetical protein